MGLFSKIFGTYSEREVKKITPIIDKIEALRDKFDEVCKDRNAARAYTYSFIARLERGESLDDILPEAFALVRATAKHVIGKEHYRVQLIGGVLLHQGRIAEMKTGEGKTLVATLPAYLNALTGKGVHVVTVNEYLAERDSVEMGQIFEYLGLSVGLVVSGQHPAAKKQAYDADITYGTNSEFGFDYLRDNTTRNPDAQVQRGHNFAIVDEVDSVLIDDAKNPLIISGVPQGWSEKSYEIANECVRRFKPLVLKEMDKKQDYLDVSEDYIIDETDRTVSLTERGVEKVERFYQIDNLGAEENNEIYHRVNNALKAHGLFKRDVDYMVRDNQVLLIDQSTGRVMLGRQLRDGLHQAIEAKEKKRISVETRTTASVTYQNFFRLYKKLSGMTGTAMTEENEFKEIYSLDVVAVPTNEPMRRIDKKDIVYRTRQEKLEAIVAEICERHAAEQPILVGTTSVEKSEELAALLKAKGIRFTVLNAKDHGNEALTIAQAGRPGAVTIATNMAGRGTDIILGGNADSIARTRIGVYRVKTRAVPMSDDKNDKRTRIERTYQAVGDKNIKAVERELGRDEELIYYSKAQVARAAGEDELFDADLKRMRQDYRRALAELEEQTAALRERARAAGGLYVIGTERHENRRIDNQLAGRSGRQGDEGGSQFFLSLEDDLIRLFGRGDMLANTIAKFNLPYGVPIDDRMLSGAVETAQKRHEAKLFSIRKHTLSYDDVINAQRHAIYAQRAEYLGANQMRAPLLRVALTRLLIAKKHSDGEKFANEITVGKAKYVTASLKELVPAELRGEELVKFFVELIEFNDRMREEYERKRSEAGADGAANEAEPEEIALQEDDGIAEQISAPRRSSLSAEERVAATINQIKSYPLSEKILKMITDSVCSAHDRCLSGEEEYGEEQLRADFPTLFDGVEEIPESKDELCRLATEQYAKRHLKFKYEFEKTFMELYDTTFRMDRRLYRDILSGEKSIRIDFEVDGRKFSSRLSNSAGMLIADSEIVFDPMFTIERTILLELLDEAWIDHLEALDEVRDYVGLNSYAQRDPLVMYKLEASRLYSDMMSTIFNNMAKKILTITPKNMELTPIYFTHRIQHRTAKASTVNRNELCPCGSGLKYKDCCEKQVMKASTDISKEQQDRLRGTKNVNRRKKRW